MVHGEWVSKTAPSYTCTPSLLYLISFFCLFYYSFLHKSALSKFYGYIILIKFPLLIVYRKILQIK